GSGPSLPRYRRGILGGTQLLTHFLGVRMTGLLEDRQRLCPAGAGGGRLTRGHMCLAEVAERVALTPAVADFPQYLERLAEQLDGFVNVPPLKLDSTEHIQCEALDPAVAGGVQDVQSMPHGADGLVEPAQSPVRLPQVGQSDPLRPLVAIGARESQR